MEPEKQNDEIICVHFQTGETRPVKRFIAEDKNWQDATGYKPQNLNAKKVNDEISERVKSSEHTVQINDPNSNDVSNETVDELANAFNASQTTKRTYNRKKR